MRTKQGLIEVIAEVSSQVAGHGNPAKVNVFCDRGSNVIRVNSWKMDRRGGVDKFTLDKRVAKAMWRHKPKAELREYIETQIAIARLTNGT